MRGMRPFRGEVAVMCAASALGSIRRGDKTSNHTSVLAAMARDLLCVTPDAPIDLISAVLAETGMNEVPVVREDGTPVGLVARRDLDGLKTSEPDGGEPFTATSLERAARPLVRTAADVMRPVAITLRYRVSIATAAAVLTCEKVSSILVVDDRGALCGVLTVEDLAH